MNTRLHSLRAISIAALVVLPAVLAACGGEAQAPAPIFSSGTVTQHQSAPNMAVQATSTTAGASLESQGSQGGAVTNDMAAAAPTSTTGAPSAAGNASSAGGTAAGAGALQQQSQAPVAAPPQRAEPFVDTGQDRLSTFSMDVDTGSYSAARNYINAGYLPPAETVRVEEFVNYFHYSYPLPQSGAFGIYVDSVPSPFGQGQSQKNTHIVRVGVQGKRVDAGQRKDAVLTFVIDVSGSMQEPNRLSLVKQALGLLVNELGQSDQVGIVVYGSNARVLLDHTTAANKERIMQAIDSLGDEGSTNAEAGLLLGYEQASKHFKPGATNRVIICSDGVANTGVTTPEAILNRVHDYAVQGIYLTTVGFGMDDYNDYLMEQLADKGNGSYAYVDTLEEARRIFVENLTGTLQVIARDAKIQVDFNPAAVARYRLLGYENRDVADKDFRNDKVDAGEVGAGHSVTALYEVELTKEAAQTGNQPALTVQVRYADPQDGQVREISQPFSATNFGRDLQSATPQLRLALAAAGFAEQLRSGNPAQYAQKAQVLKLAQQAAGALPQDMDAQELARLVAKAADLR